MNIRTEQIEFGSTTYQKSVFLRTKVLRKPLGLSFSKKELSEEENQYHLVLFDGLEVVGITLLKPLSQNSIKLRQFAIDPAYQGQGLGQRLLAFAEELAKGYHYREIVLHARETAVNFYKKNGYIVEGELFIEVGLPHFKMKKSL